MQGVIGAGERERGENRDYRPQEVAFALAKRILDTQFNTVDDKRPWLFPRLAEMCRAWIEQKVHIADGYRLDYLMTITEAQVEAAEQVWNAITRQVGNRRERLRPMINRFDPQGSTGDVDFDTRKATVPTEKSEVSHVTLDGKDGNTWEQLLASELELNKNVEAYVKNDHLGFTIPYVHKGRTHSYVPDFLVRLAARWRGLRSDADRRSLRKPEEPRADHRQGNDGARLVVRRGQQPRRLRPLGLHRDDEPARVQEPSGRSDPTPL